MSNPETLTMWTFPGATPTNLDHPQDIAVITNTDGTTTLVVADTKHHRIVGFTLTGANILVRIIAGSSGRKGFSGDGGPAITAQFHSPSGITIAPDKSIIISDTKNNRIRRVFLDNDIWKIETISGTGKEGFSGDGGPAIMADIDEPTGIAVSADGSIIFSDRNNNRIRRIYRNPIDGNWNIHTIAGSGDAGYGHDLIDDLAIHVNLGYPHGIAIDFNGDVLIADTNNARIQKLHHDVDGIWKIETIAGYNNYSEISGDGGLATEAGLRYPGGIACSKINESFVFTEALDAQICMVYRDPADGMMKIKRISGTGIPGLNGDGGPAISATMNGPGGIALTDQDEVVFADTNNSRVRFIGLPHLHTELYRQISSLHSYVENDDIAYQDEVRLRKAKKYEDAYNGANERVRMLMASGWWDYINGDEDDD